jgi:hypothetical protein
MAYSPAGTASSQLCRASAMNDRTERYMGGPGRPVPCRQKSAMRHTNTCVSTASATNSGIRPEPAYVQPITAAQLSIIVSCRSGHLSQAVTDRAIRQHICCSAVLQATCAHSWANSAPSCMHVILQAAAVLPGRCCALLQVQACKQACHAMLLPSQLHRCIAPRMAPAFCCRCCRCCCCCPH